MPVKFHKLFLKAMGDPRLCKRERIVKLSRKIGRIQRRKANASDEALLGGFEATNGRILFDHMQACHHARRAFHKRCACR